MKQEIIRIDLNGVNCYLGKSEEGFILFDTGGRHLTMDMNYTDRKDELLDRLEELGCNAGNLKLIVLTHGDNDHSANAAYLREKFNTLIAMHEKDVELVENISLQKMMKSFQYRSLILKILFFLMRKPIRKIAAKTIKDFVEFRPDVILHDGDDLSSYGFAGKVIHMPGHTAGSIAVLTEAGELIAGDVFANFKNPMLAPNAADFKQLKHSVNKLKALNITTVYPGHGHPFEAKDLKM